MTIHNPRRDSDYIWFVFKDGSKANMPRWLAHANPATWEEACSMYSEELNKHPRRSAYVTKND